MRMGNSEPTILESYGSKTLIERYSNSTYLTTNGYRREFDGFKTLKEAVEIADQYNYYAKNGVK